jgi:hypothetical protein
MIHKEVTVLQVSQFMMFVMLFELLTGETNSDVHMYICECGYGISHVRGSFKMLLESLYF